MTTEEIIQSLRMLDYSTCKENNVVDLIKQYGAGGGIIAQYHQGNQYNPPNLFTRATIYDPASEQITNVARISYPPIEINYQYAKYQRASTPYRPMFYGSRLQSINTEDVYSSLRTALKETIHNYDELVENNMNVIISLWYTIEPIFLFAIFSDEQFMESNPYAEEVNLAFQNWINNTPEQLRSNTFELLNFLAERFSEPVGQNPNVYKSSSIIAQYLLDRISMLNYPIDGIVFPSTKVHGKELNVAINPLSTDFKLSCVKVMDCKFLADEKIQILRRTDLQLRQMDFDFTENVNIEIDLNE